MLQAAGIDVYAQEPAQTVSRDSVIVREAPKARARRHRELPPQSTDSLKDTHSLISRDSITAIRLDSMEMHAIAPAIADSLDKVNKQNLKEMETSITPQLPKDSVPPTIPQKVWTPNPTKATWLAVVFPGGGQIYNRKFWKLPIIYGGFAGCAYALSWNGKMYKDYSRAYLDIMDSDPTTNSYKEILPPNNKTEAQLKELLRKRKDMVRRDRDLRIFAFIGVYLISIVDAYVDAELSNFDISPDLSMRIEPAIINDNFHPNSRSVGVQCCLRF